MNDTIRELLRAAFTAGENSYLSDDPLTCEDWIEALEPPSREGKVKVVVRGYVNRAREAYCEGWDGDGPSPRIAKQGMLTCGMSPVDAVPFRGLLYVTPPVLEVVEGVEVQDG